MFALTTYNLKNLTLGVVIELIFNKLLTFK